MPDSSNAFSGGQKPEDPNPASAPVILIPVTAEDAARRKRWTVLSYWGVAVVIAVAGWIVYGRVMDPMRAQDSYDDGVRLMTIGRYSQAILAFDQATKLKPDLTDAYLNRGQAYVAESKTESAIRDFSRVLELRPNDAKALVARASAYADMKDFQSAVRDTDRAIAIDPKLTRAYTLRGIATRSIGDPRKSLADFTRAIELAPNEETYFQRGATYQMLGDHRSAIADFDQVVAYTPDQAPGYFARSESKRAIGDLKGADEDHHAGRVLDGK